MLIELMKNEPLTLDNERCKLANDCADILGEDHKLVKAIKLGVCYYHADLPRSIRRIVEKGIKDEILQIIVSTTTLTEGVNLPIKNVIVHSLSLGNEIIAAQFWNAAGRARRAGFETEGHIIFCDSRDWQRITASKKEKEQSFVATGIRILIQSRVPSIQNIDDFLEK